MTAAGIKNRTYSPKCEPRLEATLPVQSYTMEENTSDYESLNHSTWDCKYNIVWIPKYRRKKLYKSIREDLGQEIRLLARCRECRVLEGHMMIDHVHMLVEIPPKYSIAQVMGYIKGKSAIYIAREYGNREKYFSGQHFWARGYFVSTVGRNEEAIREYIRNQEAEDMKMDQNLGLFPELK